MTDEFYESYLENQQTAVGNLTEFLSESNEMFNQLEENVSQVLETQNTLINRVYGYTHGTSVSKSLEEHYEDIIEAEPELAELSAMGISALLKDGDIIPAQGNRLFINGTEEYSDYAFSGTNSQGGNELVFVWFFENNGSLEIFQTTEIDITDVSIIGTGTNITIDKSWYDYADNLYLKNYDLPSAPITTKKAYYYNSATIDTTISPTVKYIENKSIVSISGSRIAPTSAQKTLKKIYIPNLTNLVGGSIANSIGAFVDFYNAEVVVPSLVSINNGTHGTTAKSAPIAKIKKIILPSTVEYLGSNSCVAVSDLILNCKDAAFNDSWFNSTVSSNKVDGFTAGLAKPTYLTLCDDWGATVNLTNCAPAAWTKTEFIEIFTDKLRNMGDDVREIKIPSAIYDTLTDEEFEIAENKGWTVGC